MIDNSTIEEIKRKMDIMDVVGGHLNLKKSGASYKALSPFSSEKVPSLYVVPSKQIFKDFSSGKGGDAITFLMDLKDFTYEQSLRFLANKYNIKIKESHSDLDSNAFVIMPFDKAFDDVFKIVIKEVAHENKVLAYRLDEELFREGMLEKIQSSIESADFLIAVLNSRNPNVLYELGYAQALGKLCLLITDKADDIPFDLKHQRHIVYDSLKDLKEKLDENVKWAKKEFKSPFNTTVGQVNAQIEYPTSKSGHKTSERYLRIDVNLEIENKLNRTSPNINSIQIFTGKKWKIQIHEQNLIPRKMKSDIFTYCFNYQINQKVGKDSWIQFDFTAIGELPSKPYKTKYDRSLKVDIHTDNGVYSQQLALVYSIPDDGLPF